MALVWKCPRCNYQGNFSHWEACALCGTTQPLPPQDKDKKPVKMKVKG